MSRGLAIWILRFQWLAQWTPDFLSANGRDTEPSFQISLFVFWERIKNALYGSGAVASSSLRRKCMTLQLTGSCVRQDNVGRDGRWELLPWYCVQGIVVCGDSYLRKKGSEDKISEDSNTDPPMYYVISGKPQGTCPWWIPEVTGHALKPISSPPTLKVR